VLRIGDSTTHFGAKLTLGAKKERKIKKNNFGLLDFTWHIDGSSSWAFLPIMPRATRQAKTTCWFSRLLDYGKADTSALALTL